MGIWHKYLGAYRKKIDNIDWLYPQEVSLDSGLKYIQEADTGWHKLKIPSGTSGNAILKFPIMFRRSVENEIILVCEVVHVGDNDHVLVGFTETADLATNQDRVLFDFGRVMVNSTLYNHGFRARDSAGETVTGFDSIPDFSNGRKIMFRITPNKVVFSIGEDIGWVVYAEHTTNITNKMLRFAIALNFPSNANVDTIVGVRNIIVYYS